MSSPTSSFPESTHAAPARLAGGCLCGRIRFSASRTDAFVCVCHCKSCQRQTGSAFSILVGVPADALQISRGLLAEVTTIGDSGRPVHRRFCRDCGSPICSVAETSPARIWIKAGTLDDTDWLSPVMHTWAVHKQAWVRQEGDALVLGGDRVPVHLRSR